jgi:hypothetical protein
MVCMGVTWGVCPALSRSPPQSRAHVYPHENIWHQCRPKDSTRVSPSLSLSVYNQCRAKNETWKTRMYMSACICSYTCARDWGGDRERETWDSWTPGESWFGGPRRCCVNSYEGPMSRAHTDGSDGSRLIWICSTGSYQGLPGQTSMDQSSQIPSEGLWNDASCISSSICFCWT